MTKETAERLNAIVTGVGIAATALALLSAFFPEATNLTIASAAVAFLAAVTHPFISHRLGAFEEAEQERLRHKISELEPFTWPSRAISILRRHIETTSSDAHIVQQLRGNSGPAAKQLIALFRDAGWHVLDGQQLGGDAPKSWISVGGEDSEVITRVTKAFDEAKIDYTIGINREAQGSVMLIIGEPAGPS